MPQILASIPILPLIILIPFLSIIPTLLLDRRHAHKISVIASLMALILTTIAVYMWVNNLPLSFSALYISSFNISIQFQLTQLTLILLVMTAIVFMASSLVGAYFISNGERTYSIIFALVEGSSLAVFLSSNLFLLYVFWEIAEIMMFFIIFVYGGYDRRYASIKFIIYSLTSSLLLLIAILLVYTNVTPQTFEILSIIKNASTIPAGMQLIIMILLTLSFMIKMPVFPFHGWLPDAHTEAPTTGSMILAGVLLKFGGYGILLMFLMLPIAANYALYLAVFFGLSAIYGSLVAFRQTNIKRTIAYTSITDMGIVALGASAMNTFGSSGALYAMLSHGIAISLLFLLAGTLNELYGTLEIGRLKGVIRNFPPLAYLFIIGTVALIGIPLTSGFIGDLLVFIGSFKAFGLVGLIPIASIIILGSLLFWVIERVFLGSDETKPYREPNASVVYTSAFLVFSTIILGLLPFILLQGFSI